jgi:hypothetical protein
MNVLDENVPEHQRERLEQRGIRVRTIGQELGRVGMHDDEIMTLLVSLRRVTFFTRDRDFADPSYGHPAYCLVRLVCDDSDAADLARRVLRHPRLNTLAKRLGAVVRASDAGLRVWRRNVAEEQFSWSAR